MVGDSIEKHLYKFVNKTARRWEHSELCWCRQRGLPSDVDLRSLGLDDHEFKYPHEADDPFCRCEEPIVDVEDFNDIRVTFCIICKKAIH